MKSTLQTYSIKNKKDIQYIFNKGKVFKTTNLIFYYLIDEELLYDLHFLIAIPKKKIKLATNRNYLKRVLKDCIHREKNRVNKLNTKIKFIVVYNNDTKIKYLKLEAELLAFLDKFR